MDGQAPNTTAKLREKDIVGLKYFDQLAPLLERLHDSGCERDRAGNRTLHFDQYCMLILLYLFNPVVKSLRGLQQASELKNVQKKLGCARTSLGSLSESVNVFDPERLKEIIAELGAQLVPLGRDPRLKDIRDTITLVDSTLLSILPHLTEAWVKPSNTSGLVKWRLHTHFEIDRHVPRRIDVTPDGGGDHDERAVLERTIEGDRLYIMDRGYAKFGLFNRIVAAKSSYVCRVRDNSVYEVIEERPLSPEASAERVTSDRVISLGGDSSKEKLDHRVRLITIAAKPHQKRTIAPGPSCDGVLRIATNMLDVPAEVIALLYHYRWTIEVCQPNCTSSISCCWGSWTGYDSGVGVAGIGPMDGATRQESIRRIRMSDTSGSTTPPRADERQRHQPRRRRRPFVCRRNVSGNFADFSVR